MKEAIAKANDVVDRLAGESKSDSQDLPESNPTQPTLSVLTSPAGAMSVLTSPAGANDKKSSEELEELKVKFTKLRANYSNFREKAKVMAAERDSLFRENKMIKRQLSEERDDNQNIGDMYLKILEILKISFDDPDRAKHLFNLSLQPTEEETNETEGSS